MTDIVKQLGTVVGSPIAAAAQQEIESLRQQLAECQAESANWFRKYMEENDTLAELQDQAIKDVNHFRTAAAESQLREKALQDALTDVMEVGSHLMSASAHERARQLLVPDSTALNSAIRQAKREALLEAAVYADIIDGLLSPSSLRRMADALKD